MNDEELDRLIARVNPYGDQTVADLPTGGAEADLLEEIMTTATPTHKPARVRRRLVLTAVAAGVALIAGAGALLPGSKNPAAAAPAYAAERVAVAEANQRVLIDAPGWKIDYVSEFGAAQGAIQFKNGDKQVGMDWGPAEQYDSYYRDRSRDSKPEKVAGYYKIKKGS